MNNPPRPRNPGSILIAGILFLFLLTACSSPLGGSSKSESRQHAWAEALRALDPADAPSPAHDITAVYLRQNGDDLQIRIDLLDFQGAGQLSLDIQIGDETAPEATPLDIHIPSQSDAARISPDPLLATVIVEVLYSEIPSHPRVDVSTPEDEISGLTLDGRVPIQTVPLLLTFYDTFAARLPAEALRSWDGAHSGPRGERHGLKHLLDALEEYQVPVVLLDLKEPENLSALDAMGVLPRIQQLGQKGLLILPENNNGKFGLPSSPFTYNQATGNHRFIFPQETIHLVHPLFSKITYIPIVRETDATQPTPNGPSLEVRRALLDTALDADEKDLLVLGGSLANSTWGSPEMVGVTMAYFASRPYIQILDGEELLEFPTQSEMPGLSPKQVERSDELSLQAQAALEFATVWAGNPPSELLSKCQPDVKETAIPDCVLANESFLAIFDPQGAGLTYLFAVGRNVIPPYTQLIGPSWQIAPGIDAYPGAFVDDKDYKHAVTGNSLIFTSTDGTRIKTFSLTETSLEVEYQTQEPVTTQIPLLVDPWLRFTPGWAEQYVQQNTPSGAAWGLENGPLVSVQFQGPITMQAFNEALDLLAVPEEPDFDYPAGHYVPFPMAIAEVEMQDGYSLRLKIK